MPKLTLVRRLLVAAVTSLTAGLFAVSASAEGLPAPTPGIPCDAGSHPETIQGYIPPEEFTTGRARQGYTCNVKVRGQIPGGGGFHAYHYVDDSGRTCAYYDTTRWFPTDLPAQVGSHGPGVYVVDMTNPDAPVVTTALTSPAMLAPHETLSLNQGRGLLAGVGSPAQGVPGYVDIYELRADCRTPKLASSLPIMFGNHAAAFAPDGMTYYVSTANNWTYVLDVSDPALPNLITVHVDDRKIHGFSISADGNVLYGAIVAGTDVGLVIFDVSQIQSRATLPDFKVLGHVAWPAMYAPMATHPFTRSGRAYVVETDEFGDNGTNPIGAARIIDVQDPQNPFVVSNLRVAANNMSGLPTAYQMHECNVSSSVDPTVVACGAMQSGMRVFDIRDVTHPREVAYSNIVFPGWWVTEITAQPTREPGLVYSAPGFDPERLDIWYADTLRGFVAVHLTEASGITSFSEPSTPPPAVPESPAGVALVPISGLLLGGLAAVVLRRRRLLLEHLADP